MVRLGKSSILLLAVLGISCLDTYAPPVINHAELLVVDGFINASEKRIDVRISHTIPLGSDRKAISEQKANVRVLSNTGEVFTLTEYDPGRYAITPFTADTKKRYQLDIRTVDGSHYYSDFATIRISPRIEKLEWAPIDEGARISISTGDPNNQTRYYRWLTYETWEYTSPLRSDFKLVNRLPVPRNPDEGIYRCWQNIPPTRIFVATTQQLSSDVVYQFPLQVLLTGSEQLAIRYSMLVRQVAITAEEYEYLLRLQNTTENLGGLFDHQPSRVTGNMHAENDPSKPVLGYFSGGTVEEKRLFIDHDELPEEIRAIPLRGPCIQDTVCLRYQDGLGLNCTIDIPNLAGTEMIIGPIFEGLSVIGFLKSTDECADCRLKGGTTKRPDYW